MSLLTLLDGASDADGDKVGILLWDCLLLWLGLVDSLGIAGTEETDESRGDPLRLGLLDKLGVRLIVDSV